MKNRIILFALTIFCTTIYGQIKTYDELNFNAGHPKKIEWNTSNHGLGFGHKIYNQGSGHKTLLNFAVRHNTNSWTDALTITSEAKIGIGIANPMSKLQVVTNEDAISWAMTLSNYRNNATVSGYGVGVKLKHSSNNENKWSGIASIQENAWANNSGLALFANETEHVRIKANGNVGIGIANPMSKLQVVTNEDAISWAMTLSNYRNNATVSGYGIGVKLRHSSNNENKWSGIASVQENAWANNSGLALFANETEYVRIKANGNVGIGTTTTGSHKLAVEGSIGAREINVESSGWSDFVFEDGYNLKSLEETEQFILENKHLPDIPSKKEVKEQGINLGEMDAKLLQKIEELTLYLIEQSKLNQDLLKKVNHLEKELKALTNK